MFIREIIKKKPGYEKEFITHRLVESYRTEKGPRQRTILNLGKLDLPKEQWKILADRIEAEITGQQSFYPVDKHNGTTECSFVAGAVIAARSGPLIKREANRGHKKQ